MVRPFLLCQPVGTQGLQNVEVEYMIGAGAILETGDSAKVTPATVHARVDPALADAAQVVAIDFEGSSPAAMRRLLVMIAGWKASQFRERVTARLFAQSECSLADVLTAAAQAACAGQVHLFANWLPDEATYVALTAAGLEVILHPLEALNAAAVVAGQRHTVWKAA